MSIRKPYKRTCRQLKDGTYANSANANYILHIDYAKSPRNYIDSFLLIQKDLESLFNYIEPSDDNLNCFSYRIHELLVRSCIEVEANLKAILLENDYHHPKRKPEDWTMSDYRLINKTHRLSEYEVKFPRWDGENSIRKPFAT